MQFERWSWIEGSHAMRLQMLALVSDDDLAFSPGGLTMTLGELCREIGETQHSYIQSFKTFSQDFDYHTENTGIVGSVEQLKAWYMALDAELQSTLETFSVADVQKPIARPGGYSVPSSIQAEIYLQALLIFFGKMTIYLRILNKSLPQDVADWIG